ncbi:hypothetical protein H6G36_25605 [Anabaena minutissima FACHB-250]|nr:hypothetical protein [Anabaena minutissima FACHB-250]
MEQQESKTLQLPPSRRLRQVQRLSAVNVYGFFLCVGLTAANVSRLFAWGGVVYAVVLVSVIGLSLLKAEVDARKVSLLGIAMSAIAFWDAIVQFLLAPIFVGFWIIPLWQCLIYLVSCLMILIGMLSVAKARD